MVLQSMFYISGPFVAKEQKSQQRIHMFRYRFEQKLAAWMGR